MEFEKTYTMTDIAEKLGRSRTSVNEWVHLFKEYIEPHVVGKGRTKRYKATVLPVLTLIEKLKNEGQPNDYIKRILGNNGNEAIVEITDTENESYLTQMADAFKTILEEMNTLKEQNEAMREEMEAMKQAAVTIEQRNQEREQRQIEREKESEQRQIEREKEREKEQKEQAERFNRLFDEMEKFKAEQEPKGFFARLFGK